MNEDIDPFSQFTIMLCVLYVASGVVFFVYQTVWDMIVQPHKVQASIVSDVMARDREFHCALYAMVRCKHE